MKKEPNKKKASRKTRAPAGEHVIPPPAPISALGARTLRQPEHQERAIREYVEIEAEGETVIHLEKITTEHLPGRSLDAWDVRTDGDHYWVITNPTNLYTQELFPSLDYAISFHVGVTERMSARQLNDSPDEERDRLASAWRRWEQATSALIEADEAEEFQAVGMRCRECLITLFRALAKPDMVAPGKEAPKAADVVQWSELVASAIARGSSAHEVRGYLKSSAKSAWHLVNWLTHAANATRFDALMAVDATNHLLGAFGAAIVRYERGGPERCPQCTSYKLVRDYRPDLEIEPPYATLCESCGWTDPAEAAQPPTGGTTATIRATLSKDTVNRS